jgi:trk system potassium uptake protein TrkA
MERVEVSDRAEVLGKPLKSLNLPAGCRIGTLTRAGQTLVPTGETILEPGDSIALVGPTDVLDRILPKFRKGQLQPRRVVIMGGSPISVWLTRVLSGSSFKVRLYVLDQARALELAEKLAHATILKADPVDPEVFVEENVADADAFVGATNQDEHNILGALQARHLGVKRTVAVINRSTYHQMIEGLGIDHVFSPRIVATREIQRLARPDAVQQIAQLDEHGTVIYEIRVGPTAQAVAQTVEQLQLPPGCVLIAVQRGEQIHVPGARDVLEAGDTLVAIAQERMARDLKAVFAGN